VAFSPAEIREALEHLVDELAERGVPARITIVGGAAMALAYALRASTRDVDATYRPVDEVEAAAAAVAERYGYAAGWINDEVAQFSPPGGELEPTVLIERDGVTICVAGPRHMLAMKLHAARGRRDETDIEALLDHCAIRTLAAAEALFEEYYPDFELSALAVAVVRRHVET
jgi:predicted nucleotidyltransferase